MKIKNLFQNPHEMEEKNNNMQLREQHLRGDLERELARGQLPYSESHRPHYQVAGLFTWLSNSYSFLTGSFAGGFLLYLQLGFVPTGWAVALSIMGGVMAAFLLEWAKRSVNEQLSFEVIFRRKYRPAAITAVILIAILSISGSFYASLHIPRVVTAPPAPIDTDSIKAAYDHQIKGKLNLVNQIMDKGTWRGTLTRMNQATLQNLQKDVSKLEEKRDSATMAAGLVNVNQLEEHEATTSSNGWLLGWITLGSELIFIACFFYRKRYKYKSANERGLLKDQGGAKFNNMGAFTPFNIQANQKNQIGFKLPSNNAQNNAGQKAPQNPVITGNAIPILIKETVVHIDKINGEHKEVNAKDIQRYINTYEKRVDESIDRLQRAKTTEEKDKIGLTLKNRLQCLNYWYQKQNELFTQIQKALSHATSR